MSDPNYEDEMDAARGMYEVYLKETEEEEPLSFEEFINQ